MTSWKRLLIMGDVGANVTVRIMRRAAGPGTSTSRHHRAQPEVMGQLQEIIDSDLLGEESPLHHLHQALGGAGDRRQRRGQDHHHRQAGRPLPGRGQAGASWRAADTFRAAAAEQLAGLGGPRRGAHLIKPQGGRRPRRAWCSTPSTPAKARDADVIICDTAGRLHNKKNLMDELAKIARVIDRELPDAASGGACWCWTPPPVRTP